MKAFVITLKGNEVSEKGAKTLKESSQKFKNPFDISTFDAVTADMAETTMRGNGVTWTYPWDQQMVVAISTVVIEASSFIRSKSRSISVDFEASKTGFLYLIIIFKISGTIL